MLSSLSEDWLLAQDLATVIEEVRANEAIYQNGDLRIIIDYEDPRRTTAPPPIPGMTRIISRTDHIHYVAQDGLFRVDRNGMSVNDQQKVSHPTRTRAFGGETTRLLEQGQVGNIIKRSLKDEFCISPHMLLLQKARLYVPLSTYLSGTEAMRSHPDSIFEYELNVKYEGRAQLGDFDCEVVLVDTIAGMPSPHSGYRIWMARDRNLLPCRIESFTYRYSMDSPVGIAEVNEWIKLDEGVWYPKRAEKISFNKKQIRTTGKRLTQWKCTYDIEQVSLDPMYDLTYFQEVPFPDGISVYELDLDEQITKSYRQGEPKKSPAEVNPGDQ